MCTWRRPQRLPVTVSNLLEQQGVRLRLFIWNNNLRARDELDSAIVRCELPIDIWHSETNTGGFGRFFLARELTSIYPFIITIDDDQRLAPDAIAQLLEEYQPQTVHSSYSFRFLDSANYWRRERVQSNDRAHYCGTGGAVWDSDLFKHAELFHCPRRFWFIEDLWASYFASGVLGWGLFGSGARIWSEKDGLDQYHGLRLQKSAFLRYLRRRKWHVLQQI